MNMNQDAFLSAHTSDLGFPHFYAGRAILSDNFAYAASFVYMQNPIEHT